MTTDNETSKFIEDMEELFNKTPEAERPDLPAQFFALVEFVLTYNYACLPRYQRQRNLDDGWPHGRVYDSSLKREFSYYDRKFSCTILITSDPLYILMITFNEFCYLLLPLWKSYLPYKKEKDMNKPLRIESLCTNLFEKLFSKISLNTPFPEKTGVERDAILCNLPDDLKNLDPSDCIRNETADAFYNSIPEEDRQSVFDNYNDEAMLFSVINFIYTSILKCKKLDSVEYLPNQTYNNEKSKLEYHCNYPYISIESSKEFKISLLTDSVSGYFYLLIWEKYDYQSYERDFKLSKHIVPTMKRTDQDIYLDNFRFQTLINFLQHTLTKCVRKLYIEKSKPYSRRSSDD